MKRQFIFYTLFCFYVLPAFVVFSLSQKEGVPFRAGETLYYNIYYKGVKVGTSVLKFKGEKKLGDRVVYYITFYTHTPYFKDLEKIYADKDTFLPLRVERKISRLAMPVMYISEEYDQEKREVVIRKRELIFSKKIVLRKKNVIDNPILSVYRYRFLDDLGAGDELVLNFPRRRFRVKYEGVREIKIKNMQEKARVFRGYPVGFQVWLKEGKQKLPLKIENPRLFGYALVFTKVDYFDR